MTDENKDTLSENLPETEADENETVQGEAPPMDEARAAAQEDPPADDNPMGELLQKLEEAQAEAKANKDKLLRSVADLENYRKRAAREKEEIRKYGASALVEDLLPAIDNLELGLKSAQDHHPEAKAVIEGIQMVTGQLMNVLKQHGLEEVNPEQAPFDPNLHEAVSHIPSEEVEAEHVAQVVRKGYALNGRLLRPATVVVSSGKSEK